MEINKIEEIKNIFNQNINWQKGSESDYIFTAIIDGKLWKLRLNDFPEEPLCTLIWEYGTQDLKEIGEHWTLQVHRGE